MLIPHEKRPVFFKIEATDEEVRLLKNKREKRMQCALGARPGVFPFFTPRPAAHCIRSIAI